jgi:hypothetical protein
VGAGLLADAGALAHHLAPMAAARLPPRKLAPRFLPVALARSDQLLDPHAGQGGKHPRPGQILNGHLGAPKFYLLAGADALSTTFNVP